MGGTPEAEGVLASAVQLLTEAVTPEEVLATLARLVVPDLGTWCLADLLQAPDLVIRVAALGPDGDLPLGPVMGRPHARRSSAQGQGLLAQLLENPLGLLRLSARAIAALMDSAEPRLRAQGQLAMELGSTDVLILGLLSRNRPMGVLTLGRAGASFSDGEIAQLRRLALLAGTVLDNFRLAKAQRNIATALQTHLLPPLPSVVGLTLAARYVPADLALEVGGDWYDVFSPRPGVTSLVIGDATGHDVDAATRMAEVRSLLRGIAVGMQTSPAEVLGQLDRVASVLGAEASATCLYAEVRATGGGQELHWSSAGHLPPLLLREGTATILDTPPDLMLGVDAATARTSHVHALRPGDQLLLYTDGLIETRGVSLDERLRLLVERFQNLQSSGQSSGAEEQVDALVEGLAGGGDDLAVLLAVVT